jgi:hypothetical protein
MPADRHRYANRDLWDKIWRDEHDDIVIWQWPNPWLIAWALLTLVSLVTLGKVSDVFTWIATVSLIIWSLLELFIGANYFRRALGALVLVFSIMMIVKIL